MRLPLRQYPPDRRRESDGKENTVSIGVSIKVSLVNRWGKAKTYVIMAFIAVLAATEPSFRPVLLLLLPLLP